MKPLQSFSNLYKTKRPAPASGSRIVQVFTNCDLRYGHNGLTDICHKKDLKVDELSPGEMIIFLNKKTTMLKAFGAGNTILVVKRPKGISLEAISRMPLIFNISKRMDYDAALFQFFKEKTFVRRPRIQAQVGSEATI